MYEKIKAMCIEKGITITALERELKIAKGSLSKIDRHKPSAERLQKIAEYFGVSVDYFTAPEDCQIEGYYVYGETAEVANEILNNSDMRILFDAAKGSDPEALKMAAAMLRKMKGNGE